MKKTLVLLLTFFLVATAQAQSVWPVLKAKVWFATQAWPVGANFVPSTAINQLEMWQADTFDTLSISKELGWAQSLGMNTMRVFLHDLAYAQDSAGFLARMNTFLQIASRYKIKPLFVFFDSVWDPNPQAGKQREPKPYTHNSGWVQSPGAKSLSDESDWPRLEGYVKAVVRRFKSDNRIWGWDVWNEPDNMNGGEYNKQEPRNKLYNVLQLLQKTFNWARSQGPAQPLTSGVWWGVWSANDSLRPIWKVQLENSDIISFHNYDNAAEFEKRIKWLQRYNRPIICTEYMARGNGSFFKPQLEIAKRYKVGMYNWGFVDGKSQTIYPWDSWDKQYTGEPQLWFHDIFRRDGTPYKEEEVKYIKEQTQRK